MHSQPSAASSLARCHLVRPSIIRSSRFLPSGHIVSIHICRATCTHILMHVLIRRACMYVCVCVCTYIYWFLAGLCFVFHLHGSFVAFLVAAVIIVAVCLLACLCSVAFFRNFTPLCVATHPTARAKVYLNVSPATNQHYQHGRLWQHCRSSTGFSARFHARHL